MQSLTLPLTDLPADSLLAVAVAEALKASGLSVLSLHRGVLGNVTVVYRIVWNTGQTDLIEPIGVEKQSTEELAGMIARGVKASVR